jgi:cholesterol oxidase
VITGGVVTLVEHDLDRVDTWRVRYALLLATESGERYRLDGHKTLHNRPGFDAWSDTTTLAITISTDRRSERRAAGTGTGTPPGSTQPDTEPDVEVGAGVVHAGPRDVARMLRRIEVRGVPAAGRRRAYTLRVARLFAGHLLRIYGGPLDEARRFPSAPVTARTPARRELRLPAPDVRWCGVGGRWHDGGRDVGDEIGGGRDVGGGAGGGGAGGGVGPDAWLRLTRYRGGERGPVLLASGFGMSVSAFLADTIPTNLTEHLVAAGFDVWLFDYRASIALPSATTQFTLDEIATEDWPTAVAEVRRITGAPDVQAFGHCVGSATLMMALGAGQLPDVRSAICAQFTLHPVSSSLNRLKTTLHVGEVLGGLGLRLVRPERFTVPGVALDGALRALPMRSRERCGLAVCRWINGIFGCTHRHEQLNQETHLALNEWFGVGNTTSLVHLSKIMRRGLAVDRTDHDTYTRHPERLRIPIRILQGTDNYIFLPDGSARTLRWLRGANDPGLYDRQMLQGYAHLDAIVGRDAARDVYPLISEHLLATARGTARV